MSTLRDQTIFFSIITSLKFEEYYFTVRGLTTLVQLITQGLVQLHLFSEAFPQPSRQNWWWPFLGPTVHTLYVYLLQFMFFYRAICLHRCLWLLDQKCLWVGLIAYSSVSPATSSQPITCKEPSKCLPNQWVVAVIIFSWLS